MKKNKKKTVDKNIEKQIKKIIQNHIPHIVAEANKISELITSFQARVNG